MKKIFFVGLMLFCGNSAFAQDSTSVSISNASVAKFKEQMQLSAEQTTRLDSIFASHLMAKNETDTASLVCLRARDSEIAALLTPDQRMKYDILKQEWKERQAAASKQTRRRK